MLYKGQTVLVSFIYEEKPDDLIECPGIFLGTNKEDELITYIGKNKDELVVGDRADIRAIGNPKVDGGVHWGKFRTSSISGIFSENTVTKEYKNYNKEIANTKRMLTRRKKK